MNRIAIDFVPLIRVFPRLPFLFFFFLFFYESISCYALKTTRREGGEGEDEEERKNRVSERDRREQHAFRTHLIVKMMVDINGRMLFPFFVFIIISLTIGQQQQQQRRSSVTIGNRYFLNLLIMNLLIIQEDYPNKLILRKSQSMIETSVITLVALIIHVD
jgi:hypothetical protein